MWISISSNFGVLFFFAYLQNTRTWKVTCFVHTIMTELNTCLTLTLCRSVESIACPLMIWWGNQYCYPIFTDGFISKGLGGYIIWPLVLSWWLAKLGCQFCLMPKPGFSHSSPPSSGDQMGHGSGRENLPCGVMEFTMELFWPYEPEVYEGVKYYSAATGSAASVSSAPSPPPAAGLPSEPWACWCGAGHGRSGPPWRAWEARSTSPAASDHSSGSSNRPRFLSGAPSDCSSRIPWACLFRSNTEGLALERADALCALRLPAPERASPHPGQPTPFQAGLLLPLLQQLLTLPDCSNSSLSPAVSATLIGNSSFVVHLFVLIVLKFLATCGQGSCLCPILTSPYILA